MTESCEGTQKEEAVGDTDGSRAWTPLHSIWPQVRLRTEKMSWVFCFLTCADTIMLNWRNQCCWTQCTKQNPLLTTLASIFITCRTSCCTERDQRLKNTGSTYFFRFSPMLAFCACAGWACMLAQGKLLFPGDWERCTVHAADAQEKQESRAWFWITHTKQKQKNKCKINVLTLVKWQNITQCL